MTTTTSTISGVGAIPAPFYSRIEDLHPVYARARLDGVAAFAAWEHDGCPKLCPCCGTWARLDGTAGPHLPSCADVVVLDWDDTGREKVRPWSHAESCVRVRESDYARSLCQPCTVDPSKDEQPDGAGPR